jgi:acetoin utilization protein AcuB
MLVRSKMTHDVITVSPSTTLAEARQITREHRIRHLPIVENGKLVGIISDRDLGRATPPVWAADYAQLMQDLQTRTVREHMIDKIIFIAPDAPIEEAAQLMYTNRIGCLPVLNGDDLVGILSETDLLRAYAELFGVQRSSIRIEVLMPDRPGELARVVRLIGIEMRANIVGMVVPPIEGDRSLAVMHVQVTDAEPIMEALRKIGYQVGSPSVDLDATLPEAGTNELRRTRALAEL